MATVLDIITRAMRKIGVVAHDENLTADQSLNGLDTLNMMMHSWQITMPSWSHSDLALSDTFPLAPMFHEGAVYQLASRLSPEYGQPGFDPDQWFRQLQSYYFVAPEAQISSMLTNTASQRRWTR